MKARPSALLWREFESEKVQSTTKFQSTDKAETEILVVRIIDIVKKKCYEFAIAASKRWMPFRVVSVALC